MMETIIIRCVDLPYDVRGFVREDCDGDYNVYVNAKYSIDIQRSAFKHELMHIINSDFCNNDAIETVEQAAEPRHNFFEEVML